MLRPKRKISAKAFAIDVIAGADDRALMTKYRLAPRKLDTLLKKLLEAEIITEADLALREFSGAGFLCCECNSTNPAHYNFCGQCGAELTWRCSNCGAMSSRSAESCTACGKPAADPTGGRTPEVVEKTLIPEGGKEVVLTRLLRDIRSGFGYQVLLSKYGLSPGGFATLSNWLLRSGVITHSQLERISRSRSGPECARCGFSNSPRDRFCGNCGHEANLTVRIQAPEPEDQSPSCDENSPELVLEAEEFEEIPEAGTEEVTLPVAENRFIQEIRAAVSNVLSPLRKIARSQRKINRSFYQACRTGEIGKVFHLLETGADINGDESDPPLPSDKSYGERVRLHPLGVAAKNGREDVVMLLLENGADVNKRGGADLATALMETRSASVALVLLDQGADIDAGDLQGYTALMSAASDGCTELVQLLLSRGSSVNASSANGDTALMCASQFGRPSRDDEPAAFNRDHLGVVKMLLEHGADVSISNNDGFTALQLADDWGHQEIVRILREAGAGEPVAEIDDHMLGLVISMIRTRLDSLGHHSSEVYSALSTARKSVQLSNALFFLSVSMLSRIARIDGGPNRTELACLSRFINGSKWPDRLQISEDIFLDRSDTSPHSSAILAAFTIDVRAFVSLFHRDQTSILTLEHELSLMAASDGLINPMEKHLLDVYTGEAGARINGGAGCRAHVEGDRYDAERIASCYRTLKCSEADSDADIRNSYRELVKEYHPDSIQGKRLPEDFMSFANKKFQEIQECYEIIMDHRQNRRPT